MTKLSGKAFLALFAAITLMVAGCREKDIEKPAPDQDAETCKGVNYFAASCMSVYYLWNEEIKKDLENWISDGIYDDPKTTVRRIRYKKNGKDYDRWTEITDDYASFIGTLEGVTTTYGCDVILKMLDSRTVCAIVTVVYEGGPAEKAGIRRGDILVTFNGKSMSKSNYSDVIFNDFLYSASCTVGILDRNSGKIGQTVSMAAVKMYENPVVHKSVFNIGNKAVGYLVFTGFTLKAIPDLVEACTYFKQEGVSELILDLRYNGGGYVITEEALASMLAPAAYVNSGFLFQQQVYNTELTEYYVKKQGKDALKTYFKTSFKYTDEGKETVCSTAGANIGISKIYAIVSSGTASASESLLVGLMPFMDIEVIGEQTLGKFCSGITYGAEDWYDDYKSSISSARYENKKNVANWGIYVMIGTYADKDGNNPCCPDGLTPDVSAEDIPEYGCQWGDENDPMLKTALIRAGRSDLAARTRAAEKPALPLAGKQIVKSSFGKRIIEIK